jgi:hypothetical protein
MVEPYIPMGADDWWRLRDAELGRASTNIAHNSKITACIA